MEFLKGISPRDYQIKIYNTCKEKNCLVVLPTGLGKTLIALMLAIERMKKFPGQKVLLLAPTKPLVDQHLNSFKKYLPELFASMELFTGKINSKNRGKIWQTADIIFSTPQCIANDLKKSLYDLSEVCLLIEDEAHRCVKNYDYRYIAEKYITKSKNPRIIGLTASPGSEKSKIKEICKNLFIEEVEIRTRDSEDVKAYLQEREFQKIYVEFPYEFEQMRQVLKTLYSEYVEELKKRHVLFGQVNKVTLLELQKKIIFSLARGNKHFNLYLAASACAQAIKLQHALELLETQTLYGFNKYLRKLFDEAANEKSKGVQKLVAKKEFNYLYSQSSELLLKNTEHPKMARLVKLICEEFQKNSKLRIIVFSQFRDTASVISKNLNKIPVIKSKVFIGQRTTSSSRKDSDKGLSQKDQRKIIQEFSSGEINILCATSIGEEGLDIPEVDAVIFYEPIPSAIRTIQRAGRTARLVKGKYIILITKNTRDESYYYVSRAREKKMHTAIHSIKEDLNNHTIDNMDNIQNNKIENHGKKEVKEITGAKEKQKRLF
ncbi:MAG: DEAD/DEAH box helicase [Nanoarchaeota archaeon]